jgi:hypothetical protein
MTILSAIITKGRICARSLIMTISIIIKTVRCPSKLPAMILILPKLSPKIIISLIPYPLSIFLSPLVSTPTPPNLAFPLWIAPPDPRHEG